MTYRCWGYCLTSNHVHLLLRADSPSAIPELMQFLAGTVANRYNRRKGRTNAFWGERDHATLVEGRESLWRCLRYIDLYMVRAGKVHHPREWAWCGYLEIMGLRRRYRLEWSGSDLASAGGGRRLCEITGFACKTGP